MSVIQNVSIGLSEEQAMLLDVARGFVRDQAPIEVVRSHWKPRPATTLRFGSRWLRWVGQASRCPTRWAVRVWAWALPCPFLKPWVAVSWAPRC